MFGNALPWILATITLLIGILAFLITATLIHLNIPVSGVFSIKSWVDVAQIVTAISVAYAAAAYYQQRSQSRSDAVAKQIRMYRTEVIPVARKVNALVGRVKKETEFELIALENIEDFSPKWVMHQYPKEMVLQNFFWQAANKIDEVATTSDIEDLFNAMEELALHIKATNTSAEPELISIRTGFVAAVECYAWALILFGPYSADSYPGVRFLYGEWYKTISRMPLEERQQRMRADISSVAEAIRSSISAGEYKRMADCISQLPNKAA